MKFELILTGWDLLVALGWQIGTMLIEKDTNLGASLFNVSGEYKLKKSKAQVWLVSMVRRWGAGIQ